MNSSRDSRLHSVAKEQGLSVSCAVPSETEVENEGIVTTPTSATTSPALSAYKKYEHRKAMSAAKECFVSDVIKAEKSKEKNHEICRMQTNGMDFEESNSESRVNANVETVDGLSASKTCNRRQDQFQLRTNDKFHHQSASSKSTALKLSSENISSEKNVFETQKEEKLIHQDKNLTSSTSSKFMRKSSSTVTSSSMISNIHQLSGDLLVSSESPIITEPLSPEVNSFVQEVDVDLNLLSLRYDDERHVKIDKSVISSSIAKIKNKMNKLIEKLNNSEKDETLSILKAMIIVSKKAWSLNSCGHEIGFSLCNLFRTSGVLDLLIENCAKDSEKDVQLLSMQLLEQNLSAENRTYVVEKGFAKVVSAAFDFCCNKNLVVCGRVGTGILEHLFKHSEETCKEMIKMGALKALLYKCRATDVEILRRCAAGLANLALFGGAENQATMIEEKAPIWLFPLIFNNDDNVKYFACLATAVLVANKEIESEIIRTGTLDLVESFVATHNPQEFAANSINRLHGQSKNCLLKLVPVLDSDREEAKSLAAFHFVVEAWIRKKQGTSSVFHEIGAVDALKRVASTPAIASKFAAQALKLIGEQVPHKLSLQVPLWTVDDVREWIKQPFM
ncbi:sterile alpha and TIR motif-containing protein 1-like protein [Leptotrombidium deliense]|uniref:Sterile alpha and TIR motif-containing protein 1-like protein n=1 Tax=Leptotrombidium deliense TaxID=299467 RepID=A0A443SAN3_9ACAR|nr:sterile alpha and TIR motif-containing protein 1-like protein [Leptotrombidium deliense]